MSQESKVGSADPWLEAIGVPRGPRGLLNRVGYVGRSTDRPWLQRMIDWPGAGKRVRIRAQDRLDDTEARRAQRNAEEVAA